MKTQVFWEMLVAYEEATILEARAINGRDAVQLEQLGLRKAQLLKRMEEQAARLGLDRRHAELRDRLEALQNAERMNLEVLSELIGQMKGAGEEVQITRRKLSSLRGVYASGPCDSGFYAEG